MVDLGGISYRLKLINLLLPLPLLGVRRGSYLNVTINNRIRVSLIQQLMKPRISLPLTLDGAEVGVLPPRHHLLPTHKAPDGEGW